MQDIKINKNEVYYITVGSGSKKVKLLFEMSDLSEIHKAKILTGLYELIEGCADDCPKKATDAANRKEAAL